jgi:hypothetical protein
VSATRVPFDPAQIFVVAAPVLLWGPARFERGQAFPWRDLGVPERDLALLFNANQLDCVPEMATLRATPGERVLVRTPEQAAKPKSSKRG